MCENQVCSMENMDEVLKIKQVLLDGEHKPAVVLADSLRRLHRIDLSCDTLIDTMIGELVGVLRKNGRTSQIRLLANALLTKWKRMIDEWLADGRLEIDFEVIDEIHEKPNKPLIQIIQRSIQAKKEVELLGKPKKDHAIQEVLKKRNMVLVQKTSHAQKDTRKASNEIESQQKPNKVLIQKKPLFQEDVRKASNEMGSRQNLNKELIHRKPDVQVNKRIPLHEIGSPQTPKKALIQKKPLLQQNKRKALIEIESQPNPKRSFLQADRRKALNEIDTQQQLNKSLLIQKRSFLQEDSIKCVDNATRLEATRKRLRENYEQAEKAKRQRKIQVVELHNLPKQALGQTKSYVEKKSFYTKFR